MRQEFLISNTAGSPARARFRPFVPISPDFTITYMSDQAQGNQVTTADSDDMMSTEMSGHCVIRFYLQGVIHPLTTGTTWVSVRS